MTWKKKILTVFSYFYSTALVLFKENFFTSEDDLKNVTSF